MGSLLSPQHDAQDNNDNICSDRASFVRNTDRLVSAIRETHFTITIDVFEIQVITTGSYNHIGISHGTRSKAQTR